MCISQRCWLANEHYLPIESTRPLSANYTGPEVQTAYHRWTPLILLGMAVIFCIPRIVWEVLAKVPTYSTLAVTDACMKSEITSDVTERHRILAYVGDRLGGVLQKPGPQSDVGLPRTLMNIVWIVDAWGMTVVYLGVKALYLINVTVMWALLENFLSQGDKRFGLSALSKLLKDDFYWTEALSERFPLEILCDFQIRQMGNVHHHTVQCTIHANLVNQLVFLVVWFWLLMLVVATFFSLLKWLHITVDIFSRQRYVVGRLRAMLNIEPETEAFDVNLARTFARQFITADCYLAIRLVAHNASDVTAAELIHNLWKFYKKECNGRTVPVGTGGMVVALPPQQRPQQQQPEFLQMPTTCRGSTSGATNSPPSYELCGNGSDVKQRSPEDPEKTQLLRQGSDNETTIM